MTLLSLMSSVSCKSFKMHDHEKTILSSTERVTLHPDLGVLMDTSLSFS